MEKSYLIQRLQKPVGRVNPFAFGGGGGGMSTSLMEAVAPIWSWDYMGAAEFEFGAVPEAFQKMTVDGVDLIADFFTIPFKYNFTGWQEHLPQKFEGRKKLFFVCIKEQASTAKKRMAMWAMGYEGRTKENIDMDRAMAESKMPEVLQNRTVGWFELDNGFMCFTDEKMWRGVCELFEIKIPSKKKISKKK